MIIQELRISGYRSLRNLQFDLRPMNILTGPNGCGKSNLYNALFLISRAANGGLAQAIAEEGGMASVLWAGPRRKSSKKEPVRMTVSVLTEEFSYELRCGLPVPRITLFDQDPEVKEEYVWHGRARRPSNTFFQRDRSGCWVRGRDGDRIAYSGELGSNESVLSQLREPHLYPELSLLRNEIAGWRFYHHFRTDAQSPLRQPQAGVWTPILSHDGRDLAAALQTILESEKADRLEQTVAAAFGGGRIAVDRDGPHFFMQMHMPGLHRPLQAQEFSDGTLRYLCLAAALLSPRPGSLLALNEPETSLHPDLLEPLAKLIVEAERDSQIWITTHSDALASLVEQMAGRERVTLELVEGATQVSGRGLVYDPEG